MVEPALWILILKAFWASQSHRRVLTTSLFLSIMGSLLIPVAQGGRRHLFFGTLCQLQQLIHWHHQQIRLIMIARQIRSLLPYLCPRTLYGNQDQGPNIPSGCASFLLFISNSSVPRLHLLHTCYASDNNFQTRVVANPTLRALAEHLASVRFSIQSSKMPLLMERIEPVLEVTPSRSVTRCLEVLRLAPWNQIWFSEWKRPVNAESVFLCGKGSLRAKLSNEWFRLARQRSIAQCSTFTFQLETLFPLSGRLKYPAYIRFKRTSIRAARIGFERCGSWVLVGWGWGYSPRWLY